MQGHRDHPSPRHVYVEHKCQSSSAPDCGGPSQPGRPRVAFRRSGIMRIAYRARTGTLCLHAADPRIDRREVVQPRGCCLSGCRQSGWLSCRRAGRARTRRPNGCGPHTARNDGCRVALLFCLLHAGLVRLVLWLAIPGRCQWWRDHGSRGVDDPAAYRPGQAWRGRRRDLCRRRPRCRRIRHARSAAAAAGAEAKLVRPRRSVGASDIDELEGLAGRCARRRTCV